MAKLEQELAWFRKQWAKGKGKGEKGASAAALEPASARRGKVPRDLLPHGMPTTEAGESVCFGFNFGTCPHKDVVPGKRCPKGLHVCCFKGCEKLHPLKGNH